MVAAERIERQWGSLKGSKKLRPKWLGLRKTKPQASAKNMEEELTAVGIGEWMTVSISCHLIPSLISYRAPQITGDGDQSSELKLQNMECLDERQVTADTAGCNEEEDPDQVVTADNIGFVYDEIQVGIEDQELAFLLDSQCEASLPFRQWPLGKGLVRRAWKMTGFAAGGQLGNRDKIEPSKKRNPVLVGDSKPEAVTKELFRRIQSMKDLMPLVETRMASSNVGAMILDLGDLKWLVEQLVSLGAVPPGSGGQQVSEMGPTAMPEMGKVLGISEVPDLPLKI